MTDHLEHPVPRRLALAALIVFAAVVPLLPTIDLKVDSTLAAVVLLIAAVYMRARTGTGLGRTAVDLPALALLVAAVLATIFSVNPFVSLVPSRRLGEGLLVYAGYVLFLLAAARLDRRNLTLLLGAVVASAGLVGVIGTAQAFDVDLMARLGFRVVHQARFYGLEEMAGPVGAQGIFGGRSIATLGNPIFLGGYAALLFPLTLALTLRSTTRASWIYGTVSVLVFGALVGSQARAAWVGALLGTAVLLVLVRPSRLMLRRLALVVLLCVVVAGAVILERQASLARHLGQTLSRQDSSLQFRLFLWKYTLPMIVQRPAFGWGFSSMLGRFAGLGTPEYFRLLGFAVLGIDSPHNDLLHVAFSIGLLGLAAYLWVWATLALSLRRALRSGGGEGAALAAGLAGSLLAYLLWVQSAWTQVGPAHVFWTFGGIAVALAGQTAGRREV